MREYVALPRAIGRILAEYALIFPLVYLLTGVLDAPMTIAFLFLVPPPPNPPPKNEPKISPRSKSMPPKPPSNPPAPKLGSTPA